MKKSVSAGGVVVNSKGEVLVVSQHGTSWSLPKGHVDPGEEKLAAAKREIYEESGVKEENLELVKSLGCYTRPRIGFHTEEDKSEFKTIHMFLFKAKQDQIKPVDPENPEARWVDKGEVVDFLTHKKDKEFFLGVLKIIC